MSKKTRSQRRRERQKRRNQSTEHSSVNQPEEKPVDQPEPTETQDDQPEPLNIDDVVETLQDGDVACVLTCGEENRLQVFASTAIANAAEQAACAYVVQLGRFPASPISCECWTNTGHYGPFAVELTLQADALGLRQGD